MVQQSVRRLVQLRAGNRCEYCGLSQELVPFASFHIDHIIARQHQGGDEDSNLALACYHCNRHKGPNIAGIDPENGEVVALFHPRRARHAAAAPAAAFAASGSASLTSPASWWL